MPRTKKLAGALFLTGASPVILAIVLVAAPVLAVGMACDRWDRARLRRAFKARWGEAGKDLLLVYSDSPHWKDYVERRWLPGRRWCASGGHSGTTSRAGTVLCALRSGSWRLRLTPLGSLMVDRRMLASRFQELSPLGRLQPGRAI